MNSASSTEPFVYSSASAVQATAAPHSTLGVGGDPQSQALVNEARREIAEIVRDVAQAARSDRSIPEFFTLLVDRILRAMAAEGVTVWQRKSTNTPFLPLRSLGRTINQTMPAAATAAHTLMLSEVAREGQPVVVPPTPPSDSVVIDADVPANPMEFPAAVVPIELDGSSTRIEYLIEVFLEPESGIATQRGYLRFVAQMADLAGEFLRSEQLRSLSRMREMGQQVDAAIARVHGGANRQQVEAAIVDAAAETFGFDRVGLCRTDSPHTRLCAVSHVDRIDKRSGGAKRLREAAEANLVDGMRVLIDAAHQTKTETEAETDAKTETDSEPGGIVIGLDENETVRLVAIGNSDAIKHQDQLRRFTRHANLALQHAQRFDAIPGARIFASLSPMLQTSTAVWWMRPMISAVALSVLLIAALFPVPRYIHSYGTIRPADVQNVTAPRDATVQEIHVRHGQSVLLGEPLATLHDPALDQQITNLIGRRAVLVQKRTRWDSMLVDTSSHRREQAQQLEGEQLLVEEEIIAIDNELQQLRKLQASLVIRADRSGRVDAWRMRERLQDRPLLRGDPLMQVVADDTAWVVDARVPQNRIEHVQAANEGKYLQPQVSLEATPNEYWDASLVGIGPASISETDHTMATSVRLQLSGSYVAALAESGQLQKQSHAPARAVFKCGSTPAANLLFQDVIRSVRANIGLYFGGSDQPSEFGIES